MNCLLLAKVIWPRALKHTKILSVINRNNKHTWMTPELFKEFFENSFVPEAKSHCSKIGLPDNSKIFLVIDNSTAHPDENILKKDNI